MRKVDTPERAGFPWQRDELMQHFASPPRGLGPVDSTSPEDVMGQGDSWYTIERTFANGGDGAGMMNVGSEIAARVDSREDPSWPGRKPMESEPDAVSRSAANSQDVLALCLYRDRRVGRHTMSATRLAIDRGDHLAMAQFRGGAAQSIQAWSIPAVVIGQEKGCRIIAQGGIPAFLAESPGPEVSTKAGCDDANRAFRSLIARPVLDYTRRLSLTATRLLAS
jgi:hypothetical protein